MRRRWAYGTLSWLLCVGYLASSICNPSSSAWAKAEPACTPPRSLREQLAVSYPGYEIITTSLLTDSDRSMFRAQHRTSCPGLVRVDFYGDGTPTFAVALAKREQDKLRVALVVARQRTPKPGDWELRRLDETEVAKSPVIWAEPPGRYEETYGSRRIKAAYPVVLLVAYEAWAIVYAWTGKTVTKVWVSD